ncbi:MAG: hypothetical protein JXA11_04360 [Phycisphaerae bacterium]|nr:hypothetical protein [Phycisphaerae bacterium]
MSLKKVQSGQPMRIKADTFNSIIDATRAYKERQQSGGRPAIREHSDSNIVLVKNASGVDAERFGVLGIDGPIILPSENLSEFENRVTFSCSTPVAGTHEGKFVVLAEPIKAGAIGKALALGVTPVQISVTAESDKYADIGDAAKLTSGASGAAQILWKESGTGTKWAVVRLGGGDGETEYIGYGKPAAGQTDAPVTNPWILLTVTDAAGVPILDGNEQEQTIQVWRNAARTNLYTAFTSATIFTYVRFPQPVGGVGGCIFGRTEPYQRYDLYKPADGYSIVGYEGVTPSTDITGNPAEENHLHVRGMFYVEAGSKAFRPWFVIDPEKLSGGGKVKTDEDDTTAGFLDDEIIVLPDEGHNWITKTVTPGGEDDNKLLLEHNDWDAANTSTIGSMISIEDAGPGITITPTGTLPPEGTAWFVFKEYEDEYDGRNHSRLRAKEGLKYFIIDLSVTSQVKVDFDDTTAGFLNDEIIVAPASGYAWLTKTVTPGGANDNKLRLEHADWDSAHTTTVGNLLAVQAAGGGASITTSQPADKAWVSFVEYEDEYDGRKHSKLRAKAGTKYLAIESTGAPDYKVKTNGDDSVPGYLDDEIIVDPGGDAPYWLKKSIAPVPVLPDRKLLIEHDEWSSQRGESVAEPITINSVGGGVASVEEVTGEGYCWIKWDFYDVSRDDAGHVDVSVAGSLFAQWIAVPPGEELGDMMYWDGVKYVILASGGDQSIMYIDGDTPAWFEAGASQSILITGSAGLAWQPKGADESIFITRGGELDWFAKGGDQSLLFVSGSALSWFQAGASQSLLITGSSGLSWKPKGADESIFITRGGNLDWFTKGGDKSILYVNGGSLSWLAGPTSSTQVLGGGPGWTGNTQWITVVTDVQWNSTAHRLEKKTRSIRVVDAAAESGWTAFATATEGCAM